MKQIRVMCNNSECKNHLVPTFFKPSDFIWEVEYENGGNPKDLFLDIPHNIICQECLRAVSIEGC